MIHVSIPDISNSLTILPFPVNAPTDIVENQGICLFTLLLFGEKPWYTFIGMWYKHKQEGGFFVLEFSKLSAPSLKELFIQQLQGMILTGRLSVGAKLPPERELARQMQVSRAVVNGGVTELAQQGFLEVRPRQGTFVADYRRKGNLRTLIAIMEYAGGVLGNDEVRSILEVRRALEHLAVQRAIAQAGDEAMERLGEIVQALGQAQTHAEAAETAFLFQHELALASGNSILPLFYYSFKAPVITLWMRFCQLYGIDALYNNTQTLYGYLARRDGAGAAQWIDTYLEKAISGGQQIYKDPAPAGPEEEPWGQRA